MSHLIPSKMLHRSAAVTCVSALFSLLIFVGITTHAEAGTPSTDGPKLFVKCWEHSSAPDLAKGAGADANNIYFVTGTGELNSIDLKTGAKVWSTELGGDVVSDLFVSETGVIVATSSPATAARGPARTSIRAISKQTGITIWITDVSAVGGGSLGSLKGNLVFVSADGRVIAIGPDDGKIRWEAEPRSAVTTRPFFDADSVVFGEQNKELVRVSASGTSTILSKTEFVSSAVLAGPSDRLILGDERGNVISLSADGSTQWKFKNGARISSILPYESEYIATSFDNFVYKLSRGGNVEWKRRLTGRVAGWPIVIGDAAVVSVVGLGSVYVLDLSNGKISDHFETDEESSAGIAIASRDSFTISSSRGVSLYSRAGCANKKGDAVSTSPGKKI